MKNESRIIGAEINMKDSSTSIQESKLPLDEDDQLLMQSGGGGRGGAGGGIGVGIWQKWFFLMKREQLPGGFF